MFVYYELGELLGSHADRNGYEREEAAVHADTVYLRGPRMQTEMQLQQRNGNIGGIEYVFSYSTERVLECKYIFLIYISISMMTTHQRYLIELIILYNNNI